MDRLNPLVSESKNAGRSIGYIYHSASKISVDGFWDAFKKFRSLKNNKDFELIARDLLLDPEEGTHYKKVYPDLYKHLSLQRALQRMVLFPAQNDYKRITAIILWNVSNLIESNRYNESKLEDIQKAQNDFPQTKILKDNQTVPAQKILDDTLNNPELFILSHFNRGKTQKYLGDRKEAMNLYRKVLEEMGIGADKKLPGFGNKEALEGIVYLMSDFSGLKKDANAIALLSKFENLLESNPEIRVVTSKGVEKSFKQLSVIPDSDPYEENITRAQKVAGMQLQIKLSLVENYLDKEINQLEKAKEKFEELSDITGLQDLRGNKPTGSSANRARLKSEDKIRYLFTGVALLKAESLNKKTHPSNALALKWLKQIEELCETAHEDESISDREYQKYLALLKINHAEILINTENYTESEKLIADLNLVQIKDKKLFTAIDYEDYLMRYHRTRVGAVVGQGEQLLRLKKYAEVLPVYEKAKNLWLSAGQDDSLNLFFEKERIEQLSLFVFLKQSEEKAVLPEAKLNGMTLTELIRRETDYFLAYFDSAKHPKNPLLTSEKARFLTSAFFFYRDTRQDDEKINVRDAGLTHQISKLLKSEYGKTDSDVRRYMQTQFKSALHEFELSYYFMQTSRSLAKKFPKYAFKEPEWSAPVLKKQFLQQAERDKEKYWKAKLYLSFVLADDKRPHEAAKLAGDLVALDQSNHFLDSDPTLTREDLTHYYLDQLKWSGLSSRLPDAADLKKAEELYPSKIKNAVEPLRFQLGFAELKLIKGLKADLPIKERNSLVRSALEELYRLTPQLKTLAQKKKAGLLVLKGLLSLQPNADLASARYLLKNLFVNVELAQLMPFEKMDITANPDEKVRQLVSDNKNDFKKMVFDDLEQYEVALDVADVLANLDQNLLINQDYFVFTRVYLKRLSSQAESLMNKTSDVQEVESFKALNLKRQVLQMQVEAKILLAQDKDFASPTPQIDSLVNEVKKFDFDKADQSALKLDLMARLELLKINYFVFHRRYGDALDAYRRFFNQPPDRDVTKMLNGYYALSMIYLDASSITLGENSRHALRKDSAKKAREKMAEIFSSDGEKQDTLLAKSKLLDKNTRFGFKDRLYARSLMQMQVAFVNAVAWKSSGVTDSQIRFEKESAKAMALFEKINGEYQDKATHYLVLIKFLMMQKDYNTVIALLESYFKPEQRLPQTELSEKFGKAFAEGLAAKEFKDELSKNLFNQAMQLEYARALQGKMREERK